MTGVRELTCDQAEELITDALEGVLDQDARVAFTRHLQGCEGCTHSVAHVRQTIELLRAVPQDEVLSPAARSRLVDAFREWRRGLDPAS